MCGIAGWYGWELPEQDRLPRLRAMCEAISHRGPDDSGFFTHDTVALGMRRLSIVDVEGGHQPMFGASGQLAVVFNGEIYNHDRLRQELAAQGAVFHTRSDTEVIVRGFEREGTAFFDKLNGMFAIALWDRGTFHLVRDRMGVKPLYYAWDGRRLLFASEIKSLFASGGLERRVNPRGVWDYLSFRYVPGPYSIWEGVWKLPPAHRLTLAPGMADPRVERWWDIPYVFPSRQASDAEFDSEFEQLLGDASHLRMRADVPVGILLSGGLDSSAVAALAARETSIPIKTFSVAFEGSEDIDERPFARQVAAHLHTEHYEVVIGQQDFCDSLPELTYYTDEPLADLATVPLWHVCRLAREQVKVVLSGEGSDEILGGYDLELYVRQWQEERPRPGWTGRLLDAVLPRPEKDFRRAPAPFTMTSYMNAEAKRAAWNGDAAFPDSLNSLRADLERLGRQDPLHQTLYSFCQHWLVEDLLMKADRASMACSLELRTPFLDYRLVEWAAGIPAGQKAGQNPDGTWSNKRVLRRLAAKLLPRAVIDRPKLGFPVPVYAWLSGPLRDFAHDLLSGPQRPEVEQWLRPDAVAAALAAGCAPEAHILDRHRLWNLLILEIWARRWKA